MKTSQNTTNGAMYKCFHLFCQTGLCLRTAWAWTCSAGFVSDWPSISLVAPGWRHAVIILIGSWSLVTLYNSSIAPPNLNLSRCVIGQKWKTPVWVCRAFKGWNTMKLTTSVISYDAECIMSAQLYTVSDMLHLDCFPAKCSLPLLQLSFLVSLQELILSN